MGLTGRQWVGNLSCCSVQLLGKPLVTKRPHSCVQICYLSSHFICKTSLYNIYMTQSQYRDSLLSPGVSKILTACWFKKTLLLGYVQKAFRLCLSWGVDLVEVGQKKDFIQKKCRKTAFLSGTNLDHLTLEGHNSLNFKDFWLSQGCFWKFGT